MPMLTPTTAAPTPAGTASLTSTDARILELEQRTWRTPGAKEQAILDDLGMTTTRYYQTLNKIIDTPEALRSDPVLVNRLRAQRARRLARRTAQAATTAELGRRGWRGPK
jgi:hypothetical protein